MVSSMVSSVKVDVLGHHKEFNDLFEPDLELKSLSLGYKRPKNRFQIYWNHLMLIVEYPFENCIVLSFDNIGLILLRPLYALCGRNYKFVIHNNYDISRLSWSQRLVFSDLLRKFKFIALNQTLKDRILKDFDSIKFLDVILHPRMEGWISNNSNNLAFIHGRFDDEDLLKDAWDIFSHYEKVYTNKLLAEDQEWPSTLVHGYIEDFDKVMSEIRGFYFIKEKNYRCYGILHKALSMDSVEIYIRDRALYDEYKNYSPSVKFLSFE